MDGEDEDIGWDGPNIRPPPVKQDSGSRSRFGSDRDRKHRAHHRPVSGSGSVHSKPHSRASSHLDSRGNPSRAPARDNHRRGPVEDLRGRIGQSKSSGNEHRHRQGGRESERNRSQRVETSTRSSDSRDRKPTSARHDVDVRRQRQEVQRQTRIEEQRVHRKREHSRTRTDENHKQPKKSEDSKAIAAALSSKGDEKKEESGEEEEDEEEGSDENENDSGSESSSGEEESESGEVESSSSSSSDDDTASEQAENTPEHEDEEEEEGEEAVEVEASKETSKKNIDDSKQDSKRGSKQDPKRGRWKSNSSHSSRRSDYSDGQSRTPSRSPTPRRRSDNEDSMEASAKANRQKSQENSPDSRQSYIDGAEEPEHEQVEAELPPYLPSVYGCRNMEEFELLNKVEEGTYGVVYRAMERKTKEIVALKRLKMEKEKEGFPITSLREINTLLISQHPNVVTVREIVVGSDMDRIYIVMEFVEHDMKSLMDTMREKQQVFLPGEIKCLMMQLLKAIAYLHDNWILHRDIKASNLLLSHNGILKVGDFGLAREYGSPLKAYTSIVVTLWYRAPELLLGIKEYSTFIDVWSVGCIFGELLQMKPLFTGKSDPDQLSLIYKLLGTPSEKIWTGYSKLPVVQKVALPDVPAANLRAKFPAQMVSDVGLALFRKYLTYDPHKRITCKDALKDDYFKESPLAIDPSMFPTWPAKSEMSARGQHAKKAGSPRPPSGGGAFKKMKEDDNEYSGFVLNPGKASAPAPWNLKF